MKQFLVIILSGIILVISSCTYKVTEEEIPVVDVCDTLGVIYSNDVQTIISNNCNSPSCHGGNVNLPDYSSYEGLKTSVDNGKITQRVLEEKNMPPSGPLDEESLERIECWINEGAPNN